MLPKLDAERFLLWEQYGAGAHLKERSQRWATFDQATKLRVTADGSEESATIIGSVVAQSYDKSVAVKSNIDANFLTKMCDNYLRSAYPGLGLREFHAGRRVAGEELKNAFDTGRTGGGMDTRVPPGKPYIGP